jgi:hypothetical protein
MTERKQPEGRTRQRKKPSGEGPKDRPSWDPKQPLVHVERDASGRVVTVRHPNAPYVETWNPDADPTRSALRAIAARYVTLLAPNLGLDRAWIDLLAQSAEAPTDPNRPQRWPASDRTEALSDFGPRWLAFRKGDPRGSLWVDRRRGRARPADRTAVLLAVLHVRVDVASGPVWVPLYGGQGLRIVAHVGPDRAGPSLVRVTGLTNSLPYSDDGKPLARADAVDLQRWLQRSEDEQAATLAYAFGLERGTTLAASGYALSPGAARIGFDMLAVTTPPADRKSLTEPTSYALVARLGEALPRPVAKRPLVAHAGFARVFPQDPASRFDPRARARLRPERSSSELAAGLSMQRLRDAQAQGAFVFLRDGPTSATSTFDVVVSEFAPEDRGMSGTKRLPLVSNDAPRTHKSAAANAYVHVQQWFARMRRYGFDPATHLPFVTLPITVRYRSRMTHGWGRDGRGINAQVTWLPKWTGNADSGPQSRGSLEVRFALADLSQSPSVAPLGLAADPRWAWHEFCHVLLAGATGELEFRFAHSAGDALAAILSDPDSRLAISATDPDPALRPYAAWRGVTFPWVDLPARRHDREAARGWSWSGALNQREFHYQSPHFCDRKGYWVEQILSSTLFMLYRAIGGDATTATGRADRRVRRSAADYASYLIVRAILSLGPASATVTRTPDQFVSALMEADAATLDFATRRGYPRAGGWVHKVVRWAFENQGLYAAPGLMAGRAGTPEPVDLFIDDGRGGTYRPVDLRGESWWSLPSELAVSGAPGARRLDVRVGNRGTQIARGATMRAWAHIATPGARLPRWGDPGWQSLAVTSALADIAAGASAPLSADASGLAIGSDYVILAAATCAADPSNIDAATLLPCATSASNPGELRFLVACDNNLAVRVVTL